MFSINYLVYSVNFLVCLVIVKRTIQVRKYNAYLMVTARFIVSSTKNILYTCSVASLKNRVECFY